LQVRVLPGGPQFPTTEARRVSDAEPYGVALRKEPALQAC